MLEEEEEHEDGEEEDHEEEEEGEEEDGEEVPVQKVHRGWVQWWQCWKSSFYFMDLSKICGK